MLLGASALPHDVLVQINLAHIAMQVANANAGTTLAPQHDLAALHNGAVVERGRAGTAAVSKQATKHACYGTNP